MGCERVGMRRVAVAGAGVAGARWTMALLDAGLSFVVSEGDAECLA